MQFFFATKPYGWPTHRVDAEKPGFVEHLENIEKQKLYVAHRLDKTTTGAMVFAKNLSAAQKLQVAFQEKTIQKQYYFVTDRKFSQSKLVITSCIEATKDKTYVSHASKPMNAETEFHFVKTEGPYSLWIAKPKSGKTHQIRLHAKDAEIPILGDHLYGGSNYPFLLLHSYQLKVSESEEFTASLPPYFEDLKLLNDPLFSRAIRAIEDRKLIFSKQTPSAMRWLHKEIDWLCVDQLQDHLWFQCFAVHDALDSLILKIHRYLEASLQKKLSYHVQIMPNRGFSPNKKLVENFGETRWQGEEHGVRYEFRSDSGSSYGLFLDQRKNRKWLLERAKDKRVLNLFCYTGGFSLCALKAGAKEVTSVDTSKATIAWLQRNIEVNGFDSNTHQAWAADARVFLKGAKQRKRDFDYIICDPPSFSRGKEGTFRIEKDFASLLQQCLEVLSPKGSLLFSTNFEGWTQKDFKSQIEGALPKGFKIDGYGSSDYDYEPPTENRILKLAFISRI